MCDVDADPASVEFLGGDDGGAAAAEGVEDGIALVAGGLEDALQQGEGLLCWVAKTLARVRPYRLNIRNHILYRVALAHLQVAFVAWHAPPRRPYDVPRAVQQVQFLLHAHLLGALLAHQLLHKRLWHCPMPADLRGVYTSPRLARIASADARPS